MIVDQVLKKLGIEVVEMSKFTQAQLDIILTEFKKEQDKYVPCLANFQLDRLHLLTG